MPLNDIVFGTYTSVITADQMEFFASLSDEKVTGEELKKYSGSCITMQLKKYGDKVGTTSTCGQHPELNLFNLLQEGVDQHINLPPPFGKMFGKFSTVPGSDGKKLISHFKSDVFGELETDETFDQEGATIITKCKGKSFTAFYERKVNTKGSFRYVGGKNAGDGLFPFFGKFDLNDYVLRLDIDQEHYRSTETIGDGKEITMEGKFNEEISVQGFSGITSKVGNGKYKAVVKEKSGMTVEWTTTFTDDLLTMTFVNHSNGKSGEVIMERFCDFSGTYKPITRVGTLDLMKAMSIDSKVIEKVKGLMADPKEKVTLKETGPFFEGTYHSSLFDMKVNFKLGEETSHPNPLVPDMQTKMIVTKHDNMLVLGMKVGNFDCTCHMTLTENFLIKETWLAGSSAKETVIMVRC